MSTELKILLGTFLTWSWIGLKEKRQESEKTEQESNISTIIINTILNIKQHMSFPNISIKIQIKPFCHCLNLPSGLLWHDLSQCLCGRIPHCRITDPAICGRNVCSEVRLGCSSSHGYSMCYIWLYLKKIPLQRSCQRKLAKIGWKGVYGLKEDILTCPLTILFGHQRKTPYYKTI